MNFMRSVVLSAATAGMLWFPSAARAQTLVVTFPATAVAVGGLTPGGDVAIVSHALVWEDRSYHMVRRRAFLKADSSGSLRLNLFGENAADRSLWIVMDVASGHYTIASPNPANLHSITLPATSYAQNNQGSTIAVNAPFELGEVAVLRPQTGVWTLKVMTSGEDELTAGGRAAIVAPVSSLQGMGPSAQAAPSAYSTGDIVVIVDPRTLTYAVATFGGQP